MSDGTIATTAPGWTCQHCGTYVPASNIHVCVPQYYGEFRPAQPTDAVMREVLEELKAIRILLDRRLPL